MLRAWCAASVALVLPAVVEAGGWRYSISGGYGQSAVQKEVLVDSDVQTVVRSEEPVAIQLGVERILSDEWTLGFFHSRGIRLGPISSGVSFTGLQGQWHFLGPVAIAAAGGAEDTTLVRLEWSPYIAMGAGVAAAEVYRELETVQTVSDSGIYFSGKLGVELPYAVGWSARAETQYLMGSGSSAASGAITGLHVLLGLVWTP